MTKSSSNAKDTSGPPAGAPRIPSYLLPALGVGLACTAVFYAVLLLFLRDTYLTVMFTQRTAIPYMTTYLTFTALGLLCGSYLHLRLEIRNFGTVSDLFTDVPSIDRDTASGLAEQLEHNVEASNRGGLILSRVGRLLKRVETRGSAADVASLLSEQAEIDRAVFSQSYATVRFIAWLIPVLGFIGTVGGISFAIAKFPGLFESGTESLQENIGPITGNLGVAFETTLLALIKIAVIIFVLYAVQKRGNELLNGFDEFCLDQLLGKVRGAGIADDDSPFGDLARVLSEHVERMEAKFEAAATKVVGQMADHVETLEGRFEKATKDVVTHLVENEKERWGDFTASFKHIANEQEEAIERSCQMVIGTSQKLTQEIQSWEPQFRASMEDMVRDIAMIEEKRLTALTDAVSKVENLLSTSEELRVLQQTLQANLEAIVETAEVRKAMDRLNESTEQLRPILADLQKKRRMQVRIVDEVEE